MAQTLCRTCSAPLVWQDTDQGRRPFNPDGTPHRDTRPPAGLAIRDADRDRDIRRQVAAKVAGQLLAAALQSHENARVDHFPKVADMVLAWLERGDATD